MIGFKPQEIMRKRLLLHIIVTIVWAMVAQSIGQWSEVVGKRLEDGLITGFFGLGIV